ncbi:MAG: hypothetical protein ACPIOQ_23105, partial [Promethearchaeia archaeon]
ESDDSLVSLSLSAAFDKPKKIAGTFFRPLKREASSKDQEGVIMLLRWLEEGAITLCFTLLTARELFVPGLPCVNLLTRIHCLSDA